MGKVGIMTFHKAVSHGALLQAYALQSAVEKLGYSCEIINYNRSYLKNENSVTQRSLKGKIKNILIKFAVNINKLLHFNQYKKLNSIIESFRSNYLKINQIQYDTIEELKSNKPIYNSYITGSDQVWNPDSINHEAFYFTFLNNNENTIAYAPSLGVSKITDEVIIKKMRQYLTHVKHLSCRELDGQAIIENITNRRAEYVLDPTLLLNKEEWSIIAEKTSIKRPYVLCYFLGSLQYGRKIAQKISKLYNYDLIIIPQNPIDMFSIQHKKYLTGPREFLGLFLNAEFICTDSFHGTIFAINFNKNFYSFCRRNPFQITSRISRIQNILQSLDLQDRLIFPRDIVDYSNISIKYEKPNLKLRLLRDKSIDYLKKALDFKE